MPGAVLHLPFATTKNISRCCQVYPGKQNCSQHGHCSKGMWHGRTEGLFPEAITKMCILRGEGKIRRITWKRERGRIETAVLPETSISLTIFPLAPAAAAAAAAAAAKSLQSCPTLCDPIDSSPPGSPHPWDSPGKNTGVGCHCLLHH